MKTPKPCPFCGGKVEIFDTVGWAFVRCENALCEAGMWVTSAYPRKKVLKMWNRRVRMEAKDGR